MAQTLSQRPSALVIPLPGAAASPVIQTRPRRGSLPRGVVKIIQLRVERYQAEWRRKQSDTARLAELEAQ